MTRSEILQALQLQRSVDVQVDVTLSDVANVTVARLKLGWYVSPVR